METLTLKPAGYLGEFIEVMYVNHADSFSYEGMAEPFLGPELFFNFGENFQLGQHHFQPHSPAAAIIGNRLTSVPVKASGKHFTAGIIFKPWALYPAFRIHGSEITNQVITQLALLDLRDLTHAMQSASGLSPTRVMEVLEYQIVPTIPFLSPHDSFLQALAVLENYAVENTKINLLAATLEISHKNLISLFHKYVGISPIKYLQIKLIITAIERLKAQPKTSLTELALDLGFYDQSHFIRVFKAHLQMTPGEYQRKYAR
ncbi:helix-turn-helix domain-containing protein [Adhaeribacter rhizoryzae]|uniref:AraC family transcriptional regulator n=1 Tax=Adhaeribacter rhizoryzae TaxID=2607907 RepID=A0A5M6CX17_9BACT|nr:helix-turn-helix domain-containing protein [Adhaeribacter rhizoryzae]KAA5538940.1 AraC family transcriptional regulator [Adhaeribacter rhizoryzae]